jgi:hypothetical protein
MGAKIYSQGAEIFAASCKNHFLQPRQKGLRSGKKLGLVYEFSHEYKTTYYEDSAVTVLVGGL